MSPPPPQPTLLSYCATFLPREMLHVYRQVTGIRSFDNWVVTRTRANADKFPFQQLVVLRKSPLRAVCRLWHRSRGRAVTMGRGETRQMLDFAAQQDAALAHVYLGSEALRVLRFLEMFPGGRVVSFHGADLSDEFSAASYAALWPRAELFLCRSESLRAELISKGCPADRIRINYTGVPVKSGVSVKSPPDWQSGEAVRLLQVCRLIEKKGLDVTFRAVRHLQDAGVSVKLTLAGEGPEEARLRLLAAELGIGDAVEFAGFVSGSALEQLYQASHVFLHPSRTTARGDREGIPNSLLEAMSFGLPVVSTQHSGIPEAITHGESGLLIDAANPEPLASMALELLRDENLFRRISVGAQQTVETRFSTEACIRQLEKYYDEALALTAVRR